MYRAIRCFLSLSLSLRFAPDKLYTAGGCYNNFPITRTRDEARKRTVVSDETVRGKRRRAAFAPLTARVRVIGAKNYKNRVWFDEFFMFFPPFPDRKHYERLLGRWAWRWFLAAFRHAVVLLTRVSAVNDSVKKNKKNFYFRLKRREISRATRSFNIIKAAQYFLFFVSHARAQCSNTSDVITEYGRRVRETPRSRPGRLPSAGRSKTRVRRRRYEKNKKQNEFAGSVVMGRGAFDGTRFAALGVSVSRARRVSEYSIDTLFDFLLFENTLFVFNYIRVFFFC